MLLSGPWRPQDAPIAFSTPLNISGSGDVYTAGISLYAYDWDNTSGNQTVNGVVFVGTNRLPSVGTNLSLAGFSTNNSTAFKSTTSPFGSLPTAYQDILTAPTTLPAPGMHGHDEQPGGQSPVHAPVLGRRSRTARKRIATPITSSGGNTQTVLYCTSHVAGSPGQHTLGYHVGGTSQAFTLTAGTLAGFTGTPSTQINAMQLRDVTNVGYWNGSGGSVWNALATSFCTNGYSASQVNGALSDVTNLVPCVYFGDYFYRSGNTQAVTQLNVTVNAGGIAPPNVVFLNKFGNAYAFSSNDANGISGSGSVTLQGSGQVTFAGANSYTGGTMIDAGTLTIFADNCLGTASGGVTVTGSGGGTLQAGGSGITLNPSRTITINGGTATFDTQGYAMTIDGNVGGPAGCDEDRQQHADARGRAKLHRQHQSRRHAGLRGPQCGSVTGAGVLAPSP